MSIVRRSLVASALVVAVAGCGSAPATAADPAAFPVADPTAFPATAIEHLTAAAQRQYARESTGPVARAQLRAIVGDRGLRAALASRNPGALRSYATSRFNAIWYHQHVSRLRIVRGGEVLLDLGVPFVVSGPQTTVSGATVQISIQDEIGFVRLVHRHYPMDVVVRGVGAAHVRTSLPAALALRLPARGNVVIAGHRYVVRSFGRTALGNEPVQIWILERI
jgi:hypothetical protein